ncbi:MAG: hypothetical protein US89_C0010G0001 [Candidatus Peregrinibacteria bacterium GW2011_GWF2_38_29]|nr:MAG: hypothetical protein US89_C0010G0001 [Candidatus Peregrinibacteria bacterium GW2011_GWF2_38_29]HBB02376.1 hypothetical protein [Candidatus Peregrinibacteria bacterium]
MEKTDFSSAEDGHNAPVQKRYLWTSDELLAPEVGEVELGKLESGRYAEIQAKMLQEANARGIRSPKLAVNLVFKPGKASELGSTGQPYPILESEWETFVGDVPEYCGTNIPKVYLVDGDKYSLPI